MIKYPAGLPHPLKEGYGFETTNNILRTPMVSGRARQRISFTSVPDYGNWSWIFKTQGQAQLFTSFYQLVAGDWFLMEFTSPEGKIEQEIRFTETPQGPMRAGNQFWSFTARVEIRERFKLPKEWAEILPDFVLLNDIFDLIPNREWPEHDFGLYANIFDITMNDEWAEA